MLFNLPSFVDKPLILTFAQIGINPTEYNGWPFAKIRPDYINQAADYLLAESPKHFGFYDYETFVHYEWEIDYLQQLIKIPRSALI